MSTPPAQQTRFGIRLLQAPVSERGNPWARVDIIDSLQEGQHGNVALVDRVGIRIYLAVGPGGPPSSFTLGTLSTEGPWRAPGMTAGLAALAAPARRQPGTIRSSGRPQKISAPRIA
jgi:hypothetical protein